MSEAKRHPGNWKGGITTTNNGYIAVLLPGHPRATTNGYVLDHLLVAERALGRTIPLKAIIHHVNEDGTNNAGNNLVICENARYHKLIHQRMRALRACGNVHWRRCHHCRAYDTLNNLLKRQNRYIHRLCRNWLHKTQQKALRHRRKLERMESCQL